MDLAAGGQGQFIQQDHGSGHHVVGQNALGKSAQIARIQLAALGHHIGHQLAHPTPLPRHHGHFAHLGMPAERGLHLSQFNPVAPDLHLVIAAAHKFDQSVPVLPRQIAGAIQPRGGPARPRAGDKTFCGQIGPQQVALGQAVAAHIQLARQARRHGIAAGIQQVDRGVGDGPSDGGQSGPTSRIAGQDIGGHHMGFRWTVLVV